MKQTLDTRTRIKLAARKLFAEKGVEAGTVRDIVAAAGAKNGGSLNYYFGSKDGLVAELVSDVLRASTEGWLKALSDLDRDGGPKSVRDVIQVMVFGSMDSYFSDPEPNSARFLASVLFTRRRMVRDLMQRLDYLVFQRLLKHIAELRPDIPAEVMRQRLIFLAWYVISVQAALEASIATGRKSREWSEFDPLVNLVDTATGMIEAPISDASQIPARRRNAAMPKRRSAASAKKQAAAAE
ncbi:TetR/AcrR family transcriptional regulator [Sphingomonas colocasiae]|uniref:TetR/AcrR family transcriptional regulator n=1 Tax=Sphingomonas colocasiae TaxID=1848973 RepID=A0ABS7PSV8_9SPHN|nr:TetR/AcrR family transcriptional regulator [Sphingomonas colocasiae]MBY8824298.1 TetR/AcrR family transcriptional regulator [Sphingomonas colocasiae]